MIMKTLAELIAADIRREYKGEMRQLEIGAAAALALVVAAGFAVAGVYLALCDVFGYRDGALVLAGGLTLLAALLLMARSLMEARARRRREQILAARISQTQAALKQDGEELAEKLLGDGKRLRFAPAVLAFAAGFAFARFK